MRDYTAAMHPTGATGGQLVGTTDTPLTVLSFTPAGAAMGAADVVHGQDANHATIWRNHKAGRVHRVGRP